MLGSESSVAAIRYAGFNCCTLANNHILDQGKQCCLDTIEVLCNSSIDTVGAGKKCDRGRKSIIQGFMWGKHSPSLIAVNMSFL